MSQNDNPRLTTVFIVVVVSMIAVFSFFGIRPV